MKDAKRRSSPRSPGAWRTITLATMLVSVLSSTGLGASPAGRAGVHRSSPALAEEVMDLMARRLERSTVSIDEVLTHGELVAMGRDLFFNETFAGNGRTCASCHREDDDFGLQPATIASLPAMDLLFVAEFDPALSELEHPPLMRSARGLILENIDGFDQPPVFRNSPHLLNLDLTAPYGLSGEFPDLLSFTVGAVMQHFPRTLDRVAGVDFRLPTEDELIAMDAFMRSIALPADRDFSLSRFVTTTAQRRGSDLFFGTAKCFNCHNGPVLADAVSELGGGNEDFDTGVVDLRINQEDRPENPDGGPLPEEAGGLRRFNTPPLMGTAGTEPFFHDSAAPTLTDAVAFYDTPEFNGSPGGGLVGGIELKDTEIADIVAFLESLRPLPFDTTPRRVDFGARDIMAGPAPVATISLSSAVGSPPAIDSHTLAGAAVDSPFQATLIDPTTVEVSFDPSTIGVRRVRLELETAAGNVGVPVTGVGFRSGQPSFADVAAGDPAAPFVEAVFRAGITSGCGDGNFCPEQAVSRAELAVFLVLARGDSGIPPRRRFADVAPGSFAAGFIEKLAVDGITAGCGAGNFCPQNRVTRAQMAVLLAVAAGLEPVDPPTGTFIDVPPDAFAAGFIERLALEGITAGCGAGRYCPEDLVTREQVAVFIATAFGLPVPLAF